MLSTKRRWLLRGIIVVAASTVIVGSIIFVSWRGGVTDSANILATGLSTLALLGAAAALYFQAQQTEISRREAAINHRAELIKFAINNPRLLAAWGFDLHDAPKAQTEAYSSMVFAYYWMAYGLGMLTEAELRWTCERAFRDEEIAQWWKTVGAIYHDTEWKIGRRQFARIVDEVHACRIQGTD